jgi:outer membrane protein assembly factor BamB
MRIQDLVFVGLNGRVAALDIHTGKTAWEWRASKGAGKGAGYVNLLLERNALVAGINGYVYGLDPQTGDQLWFNELKGYGLGVTSLAALGGFASQGVVLEAAANAAAAAVAASD